MFKNKIKFGLIRTSFGRVVFHLVCLCSDGKFRWHLAGVLRELHYQPVFGNPLNPKTRIIQRT
jgi:hypothetical protein